MRKLFPLIFILCIAGAWLSLAYRNISIPQEYENTLSSAYEAYGEEYYLEAQSYLNQANLLQSSNSDYDADVLQRDIYHGMQDGDSYERQLLSMIEAYPDREENYESLIRYYKDTGDTRALCRYLPVYTQLWQDNAVMKQISDELDRQYQYIQTGYFDVRYATNSIVDVQTQEYELLDDSETSASRKLKNSNGNDIFDGSYTHMSVSQDRASCFVCDADGNWSRVDISQNLLARNKDVKFDYISSLSTNNIATAVIDGEYHFINERMKVSNLVWEEAGTFSNGINAVKKNGRWAFVTTQSWGEVSEFPYTDIPRNSFDCCESGGYAVAADEKGYYIVSVENFEPVSANVYEELKAFESIQPTAYRSGDKWGFVNKSGEIYIEACYEDAKPFVNGYAAVKQNGLWGYIDRNAVMVVEPQFQDALNVMENGYAYVQNEIGYWDYVIIDKLYYAE